VVPSDCGWNVVEVACSIPSPFMNAFIDLAMNQGSQSDMALSGMLYRLNRLLVRSLAISSELASFVVGTNIIPFVSPWSTMDKIESFPCDLGRSVIRSIEIWENGQLFFAAGIPCSGGLNGWRFILYFWQFSHPFT